MIRIIIKHKKVCNWYIIIVKWFRYISRDEMDHFTNNNFCNCPIPCQGKEPQNKIFPLPCFKDLLVIWEDDECIFYHLILFY